MNAQVLTIESKEQAAEVLKYFHDFHDGFIKRIELVSLDTFDQDGPDILDRCHVCTGRFNMLMDIAHYNYGTGRQPLNRLVCFKFDDVQDFYLDLRNHDGCEWGISEIQINSVTHPNKDFVYKTEEGFELVMTRSFYVEESGWEERQQTLFSFKRATVEERLSI